MYYVANLINRRSEQNNNSKKERIKPKNKYFGHAHPPTHTSTHRRMHAHIHACTPHLPRHTHTNTPKKEVKN